MQHALFDHTHPRAGVQPAPRRHTTGRGRILLAGAGVKHYTVYYSALARADGFAFGMLLAVLVVVIGIGDRRARGSRAR